MLLRRSDLVPDGIAIGFACTFVCPGIIEAIGREFDFCWVDAQHGSWELRDVAEAIRACEIVGTPAIVRVADHTYGRIGRVLDLDPAAIILPCVDSVEQAEAIVQAARFPPLGNRSVGARRATDMRGAGYSRDPAAQPLVIAQIETPEGVDNVSGIVAVEGIDGLLFGPADLTLRRGFALNTPLHGPDLAPIARAVAAAGAAVGKPMMTVAGTPEALAFALESGYSIVSVAVDAGLLKGAAQSALRMAHEARGAAGK